MSFYLATVLNDSTLITRSGSMITILAVISEFIRTFEIANESEYHGGPISSRDTRRLFNVSNRDKLHQIIN